MRLDAASIPGLLEAARSETKRWGGSEPGLTHIAIVLARRWDDDFRDVFGEDGDRQVETLLRAQEYVGGEGEVCDLLRTDRSRREILEELRGRLQEQMPVTIEHPSTENRSEDDAADDAATTKQEPAPDDGLTERCRRVLERVTPRDDVRSRQRVVDELAAHALQRLPGLTALVGDAGVGRTAVISAVAARLDRLGQPLAVWRLAPETIAGNPRAALSMVLDDVSEPTVVMLDNADVLARLGTDTPDRDFVATLRDARFHAHLRLVVVLSQRSLNRLEVISQELAEDLHRVPVEELNADVILDVLRGVAESIGRHHGVVVDHGLTASAAMPGIGTDAVSQPRLGIERIDLACARATLAGATTATVEHLASPGSRPSVGEDSRNLAVKLAERVKGQRGAIAQVSDRLALTRANLDLRPERPNGVFLFVGPTGVGKTELAKEIALHEYGGSDCLIRLDMSEFAHDWSLSRLVGPSPGYVGSTEPENWLTTRVAAMPHCVVLLDEIEKAHPRIWNTFLQVFDAGRLTDGRGVTADFSDAVIIMTSNLGVAAASAKAVGFGGTSQQQQARERLLAVIRDEVTPELLNRMDEIVVFDALSMDSIAEIAELELTAACARLNGAGWVVEWDRDVPRWLAGTGYDPAYGARHLQRNIERELLGGLVRASTRRVHVGVENGRLELHAR